MKFGFIGTGNMGSAMAAAAAKSLPPHTLLLSNRTPEKAEQLAKTLGGKAVSNEEIAASCRYIILGVKPQMMEALLKTLVPILAKRKDEFALVSMAAAVSLEQLRDMAGGDYPIIRTMPNTPVGVGAGVMLYACNEKVSQQLESNFVRVMAPAGLLMPIEERLIDAASAIAGCGPAFACMFAEAMADGGVACGLPRNMALQLAAQMMAGTGEMMIRSGKHPEQLKDAVCSPGGTTIAGVRVLENGAFRATAMAAVEAAYSRTRELENRKD